MIKKSFLFELKDLLQNISVTSPTAYTFHGKLYNIAHENQKSKLESKVLTDLLIEHIKNTLYQFYHCRQKSFGNDFNYGFNQNHQNSINNRDFIESLSKANVGQGSWEPGWKIQKFERNGQLKVNKDEITLWVLPKQFVPLNGSNEIGKEGFIYMVKEFRALLPGFYTAIGNAPINEEPITVRIYWNIESLGAIPLMNYITTEFNKINIPFKFKILNNPNFYSRSDAAVLYINNQYIYKSENPLAIIYQKIKKHLKPFTPLFAKTLAPGVSLAEDPHNGESFGQHRSKIVAQSLYKIYKDCISTVEEKIANVTNQFHKNDLDIHYPYLNSGSNNNYDLNLGFDS